MFVGEGSDPMRHCRQPPAGLVLNNPPRFGGALKTFTKMDPKQYDFTMPLTRETTVRINHFPTHEHDEKPDYEKRITNVQRALLDGSLEWELEWVQVRHPPVDFGLSMKQVYAHNDDGDLISNMKHSLLASLDLKPRWQMPRDVGVPIDDQLRNFKNRCEVIASELESWRRREFLMDPLGQMKRVDEPRRSVAGDLPTGGKDSAMCRMYDRCLEKAEKEKGGRWESVSPAKYQDRFNGTEEEDVSQPKMLLPARQRVLTDVIRERNATYQVEKDRTCNRYEVNPEDWKKARESSDAFFSRRVKKFFELFPVFNERESDPRFWIPSCLYDLLRNDDSQVSSLFKIPLETIDPDADIIELDMDEGDTLLETLGKFCDLVDVEAGLSLANTAARESLTGRYAANEIPLAEVSAIEKRGSSGAGHGATDPDVEREQQMRRRVSRPTFCRFLLATRLCSDYKDWPVFPGTRVLKQSKDLNVVNSFRKAGDKGKNGGGESSGKAAGAKKGKKGKEEPVAKKAAAPAGKKDDKKIFSPEQEDPPPEPPAEDPDFYKTDEIHFTRYGPCKDKPIVCPKGVPFLECVACFDAVVAQDEEKARREGPKQGGRDKRAKPKGPKPQRAVETPGSLSPANRSPERDGLSADPGIEAYGQTEGLRTIGNTISMRDCISLLERLLYRWKRVNEESVEHVPRASSTVISGIGSKTGGSPTSNQTSVPDIDQPPFKDDIKAQFFGIMLPAARVVVCQRKQRLKILHRQCMYARQFDFKLKNLKDHNREKEEITQKMREEAAKRGAGGAEIEPTDKEILKWKELAEGRPRYMAPLGLMQGDFEEHVRKMREEQLPPMTACLYGRQMQQFTLSVLKNELISSQLLEPEAMVLSSYIIHGGFKSLFFLYHDYPVKILPIKKVDATSVMGEKVTKKTTQAKTATKAEAGGMIGGVSKLKSEKSIEVGKSKAEKPEEVKEPKIQYSPEWEHMSQVAFLRFCREFGLVPYICSVEDAKFFYYSAENYKVGGLPPNFGQVTEDFWLQRMLFAGTSNANLTMKSSMSKSPLVSPRDVIKPSPRTERHVQDAVSMMQGTDRDPQKFFHYEAFTETILKMVVAYLTFNAGAGTPKPIWAKLTWIIGFFRDRFNKLSELVLATRLHRQSIIDKYVPAAEWKFKNTTEHDFEKELENYKQSFKNKYKFSKSAEQKSPEEIKAEAEKDELRRLMVEGGFSPRSIIVHRGEHIANSEVTESSVDGYVPGRPGTTSKKDDQKSDGAGTNKAPKSTKTDNLELGKSAPTELGKSKKEAPATPPAEASPRRPDPMIAILAHDPKMRRESIEASDLSLLSPMLAEQQRVRAEFGHMKDPPSKAGSKEVAAKPPKKITQPPPIHSPTIEFKQSNVVTAAGIKPHEMYVPKVPMAGTLFADAAEAAPASNPNSARGPEKLGSKDLSVNSAFEKVPSKQANVGNTQSNNRANTQSPINLRGDAKGSKGNKGRSSFKKVMHGSFGSSYDLEAPEESEEGGSDLDDLGDLLADMEDEEEAAAEQARLAEFARRQSIWRKCSRQKSMYLEITHPIERPLRKLIAEHPFFLAEKFDVQSILRDDYYTATTGFSIQARGDSTSRDPSSPGQPRSTSETPSKVGKMPFDEMTTMQNAHAKQIGNTPSSLPAGSPVGNAGKTRSKSSKPRSEAGAPSSVDMSRIESSRAVSIQEMNNEDITSMFLKNHILLKGLCREDWGVVPVAEHEINADILN